MSATFDSEFVLAGSPLLNEEFGEPVTLSRGASTTASITASWGRENDILVTADGVHTLVVDRVWLIFAAAYLIGGVAVKPTAGDRITDAASAVWEVLPDVAGPAVVAYGGGSEWQINTKKIV